MTEDRTRRDADYLTKGLGLDRVPPDSGSEPRGTLIALSGLPGTGKSHFAAQLSEKLPCVVLESDHIRKLLVTRPRYTGPEHSRVFAACHLLVEEFLSRGHTVIFDATNLTESSRRPLRLICSRLSVPLLWVRLSAPLDVAKQRLTRRDAGEPDGFSDAGWAVYNRMASGEEPVKSPHFNVDSSRDIAGLVEQVARSASGEPVTGRPHSVTR